jgi:hypothetical protein
MQIHTLSWQAAGWFRREKKLEAQKTANLQLNSIVLPVSHQANKQNKSRSNLSFPRVTISSYSVTRCFSHRQTTTLIGRLCFRDYAALGTKASKYLKVSLSTFGGRISDDDSKEN